jgi:hypothetical protein
MNEPIINKVKNSGLITLSLDDFIVNEPIKELDLANQLWQGLVLKEKDFRGFIENNNWSEFKNNHAAIYCSADAIIPRWAYMLVTAALQPHALSIHFGKKNEVLNQFALKQISEMDVNLYTDARVILKGCSNYELSENVYIAISNKLLPVVKTLMYGEPCSTVPIYKKK